MPEEGVDETGWAEDVARAIAEDVLPGVWNGDRNNADVGTQPPATQMYLCQRLPCSARHQHRCSDAVAHQRPSMLLALLALLTCAAAQSDGARP